MLSATGFREPAYRSCTGTKSKPTGGSSHSRKRANASDAWHTQHRDAVEVQGGSYRLEGWRRHRLEDSKPNEILALVLVLVVVLALVLVMVLVLVFFLNRSHI